jgi:hypothetical protein
MTVTLKKLNLYLQSRAPQIELVRGKGYFYFADSDISGDCVNLPDSIPVCYLRSLTWRQWTDDIDAAVAQFNREN